MVAKITHQALAGVLGIAEGTRLVSFALHTSIRRGVFILGLLQIIAELTNRTGGLVTEFPAILVEFWVFPAMLSIVGQVISFIAFLAQNLSQVVLTTLDLLCPQDTKTIVVRIVVFQTGVAIDCHIYGDGLGRNGVVETPRIQWMLCAISLVIHVGVVVWALQTGSFVLVLKTIDYSSQVTLSISEVVEVVTLNALLGVVVIPAFGNDSGDSPAFQIVLESLNVSEFGGVALVAIIEAFVYVATQDPVADDFALIVHLKRRRVLDEKLHICRQLGNSTALGRGIDTEYLTLVLINVIFGAVQGLHCSQDTSVGVGSVGLVGILQYFGEVVVVFTLNAVQSRELNGVEIMNHAIGLGLDVDAGVNFLNAIEKSHWVGELVLDFVACNALDLPCTSKVIVVHLVAKVIIRFLEAKGGLAGGICHRCPQGISCFTLNAILRGRITGTLRN